MGGLHRFGRFLDRKIMLSDRLLAETSPFFAGSSNSPLRERVRSYRALFLRKRYLLSPPIAAECVVQCFALLTLIVTGGIRHQCITSRIKWKRERIDS